MNSIFLRFMLAAFMLAGCETPPKNVPVPMPEKPYELKHTTLSLDLVFPSHKTVLDEEGKDRLLCALRPPRSAGRPGKFSAHVTLPRHASSLGRQRLKSIIRMLLKAGVKPKQIHRSDFMAAAAGNKITLVIDIYQAIPPLCPNWSTAYGSGYSRGPTSNFGCSIASNFLLMIDDPIILFRGEKMGDHDAARDSGVISDYRTGKDRGKWLKAEKSDSGSSGSSGSSSGGGS